MMLRKIAWVGTAQKSSIPLASASLRSAILTFRIIGRAWLACEPIGMSRWVMATPFSANCLPALTPHCPNGALKKSCLKPYDRFGDLALFHAGHGRARQAVNAVVLGISRRQLGS